MFSRAHQAWRQHPWLRQKGNVAAMFPGLGTAVAIYGTYLFGDALYARSGLAPDPNNPPYKPATYKSAFEAGQAAARLESE
jgi:hypothetical protein